jgi:hypothetical protein
MELAHPAGAESLAPQPSQLASAVASTKKSRLANLRNFDGRGQPSPNAIPVARKIKKSAQDHALPAPVIGRRIVGLSDRTTMVQDVQAGRLATRSAGNVSTFISKRQISVNARKFGLILENYNFKV